MYCNNILIFLTSIYYIINIIIIGIVSIHDNTVTISAPGNVQGKSIIRAPRRT